MQIKKAIIPVAGMGTRFLPVTKSVPKELIPILDTPMIYFAVKEAVDAGINEIIFICSKNKPSIEEFFKPNNELNEHLKINGKEKKLAALNELINKVTIRTAYQEEPLGLGHAVLQGRNFIDANENFAVILPDDIVHASDSCIGQLIKVSNENEDKSVIGVMQIKPELSYNYGVISGEKVNEKLTLMNSMVEKPHPEDAPSNLATPGRYILNESVFDLLTHLSKGSGGEYQLTDAINQACLKDKVFAYEFTGKRYDTGQLPGYLEATIDFALDDPNLRSYMLELMSNRIANS